MEGKRQAQLGTLLPATLVFAADHGVSAQGWSNWSAEAMKDTTEAELSLDEFLAG